MTDDRIAEIEERSRGHHLYEDVSWLCVQLDEASEQVSRLREQVREAKREGVYEAIQAMQQEYGDRIYLAWLEVWLREKAPFVWDTTEGIAK